MPAGIPAAERIFESLAALKSHKTWAHGRRRLVRWYIDSGRCPAFGTDFHTKLRRMHHVDRSQKDKRCLTQLLRAGRMLEPEVVARLDALDNIERRAAKRDGRSELAGPPARPPASS